MKCQVAGRKGEPMEAAPLATLQESLASTHTGRCKLSKVNL